MDGTPQCGFVDAFDRTSGPGSSWVVTYPSFTTDGTYLVTGGTESQFKYIKLDPTPALNTNNYTITANLSVPTGAQWAGITARDSGSPDVNANSYWAGISTANSGGFVGLWRNQPDGINNKTSLGTFPWTITPGTVYTLKLVVTGTNPVHLEAWIGPNETSLTKVVTYDDYSALRQTSGALGIHTNHNGVKFDSYAVSPWQGTLPTPAPQPPSGPTFSDTFNRTTGLGANWVVRWGSFTTDGAYAISGPATGAGSWARLEASVGSNNYRITTKLSVPSGATFSGVAMRGDQAAYDLYKNNYSAEIYPGGTVKLYRSNDWGRTLLQSVAATITAGQLYELKTIVTGTNPVHLEVYLGGALMISYDDSSASRLTTGGPGIHATTPGVKFDDILVEALP
jgi:hypothetical protein